MKYLRLLILCLATVMLFAPATQAAKTLQFKEGYPKRYTVQPGDTLWGIAARFLSDPLDWPQLLQENPDVANPSRIYPGQVLSVRLEQGQPHLYLEPGGTVKLSPRVRATPIDNSIDAVPLGAIIPFIDATRVVQPEELEKAPFVVAQSGEHVVAGAGDKIYVSGFGDEANQSYLIYRLEQPYIDPSSKEVLGYEALHVGVGKMLREGNPATLLISSSNREVLTGDRLLPMEDIDLTKSIIPHVPECPFEGQIISVADGVTQIGQFQVVTINRGSRDNVTVGDLLSIYQLGRTIRNPLPNAKPRTIKLPDERAGIMLIFRTFDKVSYGLVLHATQAIHLLDKVQTPVA